VELSGSAGIQLVPLLELPLRRLGVIIPWAENDVWDTDGHKLFAMDKFVDKISVKAHIVRWLCGRYTINMSFDAREKEIQFVSPTPHQNFGIKQKRDASRIEIQPKSVLAAKRSRAFIGSSIQVTLDALTLASDLFHSLTPPRFTGQLHAQPEQSI
jgi:hypothetical protein